MSASNSSIVNLDSDLVSVQPPVNVSLQLAFQVLRVIAYFVASDNAVGKSPRFMECLEPFVMEHFEDLLN